MLLRTLVLPVAIAASVSHPRQSNSACVDPPIRKEWRALSADERNSYIQAVNCLAKQPSKLGLSTTRYDDFPYWDWSLDSQDPANSPIWDPVTGFGGNGNPNETVDLGGWAYKCVTNGPFKDLRPAYFGTRDVPHCLTRSFNNGTSQIGSMLGEYYSPEALATVQVIPDYNQYRIKLEGTPHGAIHSAVGGDLSPSTSPNDPIFFLHHTQIDRLWYLWQQEDPENRTMAFSGIKILVTTDNPTPPQATLDDIMAMNGIAEDISVRDAMSIQNGPFCYTY
ncbi:hypothetical protein AAE478_010458 [Parahypoxylon ruwenzoriense]